MPSWCTIPAHHFKGGLHVYLVQFSFSSSALSVVLPVLSCAVPLLLDLITSPLFLSSPTGPSVFIFCTNCFMFSIPRPFSRLLRAPPPPPPYIRYDIFCRAAYVKLKSICPAGDPTPSHCGPSFLFGRLKSISGPQTPLPVTQSSMTPHPTCCTSALRCSARVPLPLLLCLPHCPWLWVRHCLWLCLLAAASLIAAAQITQNRCTACTYSACELWHDHE